MQNDHKVLRRFTETTNPRQNCAGTYQILARDRYTCVYIYIYIYTYTYIYIYMHIYIYMNGLVLNLVDQLLWGRMFLRHASCLRSPWGGWGDFLFKWNPLNDKICVVVRYSVLFRISFEKEIPSGGSQAGNISQSCSPSLVTWFMLCAIVLYTTHYCTILYYNTRLLTYCNLEALLVLGVGGVRHRLRHERLLVALHTYTYTHMYMYMYMHVYVYVCMCIHIYLYLSLYIYIYIYICMPSCSSPRARASPSWTAPFGWHCLFNATCLIRPHVLFVVSTIIIICCVVHRFRREPVLDKQC